METQNNEYMKFPINIEISEPWDFGTDHGTGPFLGSILMSEQNQPEKSNQKILIRFDSPLFYRNTQCEYFIAAVRHENKNFDLLYQKHSIDCNLTWVPSTKLRESKPFDLSCWRGGVQLIGSIKGV